MNTRSSAKTKEYDEEIKNINTRINKEICYEIIDKLNDVNLMDDYKECKSVKSNIEYLNSLLEEFGMTHEDRNSVINRYILKLIPAGTKGVIRGVKFNNIVMNYINNLCIDNKRFIIKYEKHHDVKYTSEIPDWYIFDNFTQKIIIGMNQLDLWKGGQQSNRGYKYIVDFKTDPNVKLLCVVCNEIKFTNSCNKAYTLFKVGYENNTLCYINNIRGIIFEYFDL